MRDIVKPKNAGIDWQRVRSALDTEEWEKVEEHRWERAVFLGTVFALFPSGKYYVPYACSNVTPCPCCHGEGRRPVLKRRVVKRLKNMVKKGDRRFEKWRDAGGSYWEVKHCGWLRAARAAQHRLCVACPTCSGHGSVEVYYDDLYNDFLSEEANEQSLYVIAGEGDPCDIFVGEISQDDFMPADNFHLGRRDHG
jgi:hypothetical protein